MFFKYYCKQNFCTTDLKFLSFRGLCHGRCCVNNRFFRRIPERIKKTSEKPLFGIFRNAEIQKFRNCEMTFHKRKLFKNANSRKQYAGGILTILNLVKQTQFPWKNKKNNMVNPAKKKRILYVNHCMVSKSWRINHFRPINQNLNGKKRPIGGHLAIWCIPLHSLWVKL